MSCSTNTILLQFSLITTAATLTGDASATAFNTTATSIAGDGDDAIKAADAAGIEMWCAQKQNFGEGLLLFCSLLIAVAYSLQSAHFLCCYRCCCCLEIMLLLPWNDVVAALKWCCCCLEMMSLLLVTVKLHTSYDKPETKLDLNPVPVEAHAF